MTGNFFDTPGIKEFLDGVAVETCDNCVHGETCFYYTLRRIRKIEPGICKSHKPKGEKL